MGGKLAKADGNAAASSVRPGRELSLPSQAIGESYPRYAPIYGLAMMLVLIAAHYFSSSDYVGADNDDVMRLVEVRDLLNGQGWFDMTQYRLGLEGGTLMHWSRFIDLPIALLIRLFGLFAQPETAEMVALAVWPLLLSFTIVGLMGLAAFRMGGRRALHIASAMTLLFVFGMGRFEPGSIDHHNAQLTLAALLVAMVADPLQRASSFAIAGIAAALSIAIGAETVPFVAAACLVMALLWGFHGNAVSRPVAAFSMAFVLAISLAFFLTVPPHLYGFVTCDSLSLGFYALAAIGGFLLFLQSRFYTGGSLAVRCLLLCSTGVALIFSARAIAPQCLGNPLASLDPMLTELWLNKVVEARSFLEQLRTNPGSVGGFYAVGLLAVVVCLWRIARNDARQLHLILLALLSVSVAVSMVQVRGAMFANLLSIPPVALLVADINRWQKAKPDSAGRAIVFFFSIVVSIPIFWSVAGFVGTKGLKGLGGKPGASSATQGSGCSGFQSLEPLAALPTGVVMAASDLGVHILRYTAHRVLSAPYHRNQGGMLTELNAGLAQPDEAIAFLRGAKVDYIAFCPTEIQTRSLVAMKPDGFYAALAAGKVPGYLQPLADGKSSELKLYRVSRD